MTTNDTITIYCNQTFNGIILIWSAYSNGAAQDWGWQASYVPESLYFGCSNRGVRFTLTSGGVNNGALTPTILASKYLYFSCPTGETLTIKGWAGNNLSSTVAGNLTINNAAFVLRSVHSI